MKRRVLVPIGVVLVALIVASCGSSASGFKRMEATTTTLAPEVKAFYTWTDPIPNDPPGTVLRTQEIDAPRGTRAWRVLSTTRSAEGKPALVSGLVYAPTRRAPSGGRPVLSWAHETTGIADDCAPSYQDKSTLSDKDLKLFLDEGYVVTATDYEGLGTRGPHPYLVARSEARSVLDAVRVARALPETRAGSRFAVYGYSQGGHAALAAAQEAPTYAPELTLVGTAATAPPADLSKVATQLATERELYGFGVLAAFGLVAGYPDRVQAGQVLAPDIVELAPRVEQTCSYFAFFALASREFAKVFNPAVVSDPVVARLLAESSPGATPPEGPVLIMSGGKDVLATPEMVDTYMDRVCPQGAVVQLVRKADRDHGGIAQDDIKTVAPWIADRFAGKPAPNSCP
jgi:pimeloyl-ACP methyl ester carboxylesterase